MEDPLPKLLVLGAILMLAISIPSRIEHRNYEYGDNYIIAQAPHFYDHYDVLATVDRIMFCESTDNPEAKNPKSSAYGLCQFLNQTWDYVQVKWDMELDRHDPSDQYYACVRLYQEEGGSHWEESRKCWEIN
jgi:hypothetical protein